MMENSNGDQQNNGLMTVILIDEEIKNLSRNEQEKCLMVEEQKIGQYDCEAFIFLRKKEERIAKT